MIAGHHQERKLIKLWDIVCAVSHNFQTASKSSGVSCMTSLRKLKKQSSGFLVNNNCVFGVEFIQVTTSKANTTSETLFVPKTSIFNEAKTYTWDTEDFFALKNPDYSPEFEVGGYKWWCHLQLGMLDMTECCWFYLNCLTNKICPFSAIIVVLYIMNWIVTYYLIRRYISMYPSREGNHLSLYLNLKKTNDLPNDTGNLVELTLSIKKKEADNRRKGTGSYT